MALILTSREAATAVRLLGKFQSGLEGAIESTLLPGETEPAAEIDKGPVRTARRDCRAAENLIQWLTARGRKL